LPLTHRVIFKTLLKKRDLLSIPKLIRWQYKLESSEVLRITVSVVGAMGVRESFLGKMHKDGRIIVPKLQIALLRRDEPSLAGYALEVTIEPA
jgi:hypothetical protein